MKRRKIIMKAILHERDEEPLHFFRKRSQYIFFVIFMDVQNVKLISIQIARPQ